MAGLTSLLHVPPILPIRTFSRRVVRGFGMCIGVPAANTEPDWGYAAYHR